MFVKLNTSSVRLTTYDIVVAQYEAATESQATRYGDLGSLVLDIACLLEPEWEL